MNLNLFFVLTLLLAKPTYGGGSAGVNQMGTVMSSFGMAMVISNVKISEKFDKMCPTHGWACALAMMAAGQAIVDANASNSGSSAASGINDSFGTGSGSGADDTLRQGSSEPFVQAAKDQLKAMEKKGFKLDQEKGTFTDPKGKTHSLSSLSSGSAMLKEGLISEGEVPLADEAIKKAADKLKMVAMNFSGGGGGGGSGGSGSRYVYEESDTPFALGSKQKARGPQTSGLTRTLASGESIGARTDNIFQMVKRRYDQKKSENYFIGEGTPAGD